ncbi:hypothetical protein DB35_24055 [Streptomyces abyssalis]|uniref:DUF4031 domain-containing protein n=1 Tax=Streptomyces abyssalis TaxID=933944 RepID=A0A1E7JNR0_9ACTN|nr:DUF4031 domain-containing protein [Streptomyces abyssalis]OEU86729.1 hypothetical protein DB35_24055 [Streptomyces abyssalis]OEU89884.1 hypothetical protein AN215_09485 [Streptomyces abyssalis]
MTVYIDPPVWPGKGLVWSHLVSDVSYDELHAFAAAIGCPRRAFDRDHYDVPSARYAAAVSAGAVEVGSKELVRRLTDAGLRRPKRRGPSQPGRRRSGDGPAAV